MKAVRLPEFDNVASLTNRLLQVWHREIEVKLDAEKQAGKGTGKTQRLFRSLTDPGRGDGHGHRRLHDVSSVSWKRFPGKRRDVRSMPGARPDSGS